MRASFLRELSTLGLSPGLDRDAAARAMVTADDLAALPATAQRYLRFMNVVGRPRVFSLRLGWHGTFRLKPDQAWMRCEAWQYNTRLEIARIFKMRVWFAHVVPMIARDYYLSGHAHMLGKVLDVFPVVDDVSEETAIGELVTYLNDGVFLAPSILLGPGVTWAGVDDASFDVALTDGGRTVSARVFVDERGAAMNFSTTDRFYTPLGEKHARRTRWTTPMEGWEMIDGHPLPTGGQAVWQLPDGPFPYADFRVLPGSLALDVAPGE